MAYTPSVSLDTGRKEILDMAVAVRDIEGEPDRVVDAKEDLDLLGLAHDLAHILQVIEGEERAYLCRGQRYKLVFREFAADVVGVAFRNKVEGLVLGVDPERDLVRDHGSGLHRVVKVL